MSTFTKSFSSTAPKDLFYPNVLTPDMKVDPSKTQDAFRRVYDFLYKIQPPPGSRAVSSVLTGDFIDEFQINLSTNVVLLSEENWNSSTAGVSWNEHTLTYHGIAYTIAQSVAPTTNKFIYWSLQDANKYSSSATYPDLSFTNPEDGSVASVLIAVWNASDGKLYPFWAQNLAPAFISTALIEDASITTAKIQDLAVSTAKIANLAVTNAKIHTITADKITTGTLTATISMSSALIRTGTSGARLELASGSAGLKAYDSSGNLQVRLGGALGSSSIGLYFASTSDGSGTGVFGTAVSVDFYVAGYEAAGITALGIHALNGAGATKVRIEGNNNPGIYFAGTTTSDLNTTGVFGTTTSVDFYVGGTEYAAITSAGFVCVGTGKFTGDGSLITTLNAGNISSGTLAIARGGTNATSQTNNGICYFDTSKLTTSSNFGTDGTTVTIGAGDLLFNTSGHGVHFSSVGGGGAVRGTSTSLDFYVAGTEYGAVTSVGFQCVGTSKGIWFDSDTNTGFTGVANTSVDGFINGTETFGFANPGSSTAVSSIYVFHNNTLKQVKTKTDGAGDYLLYVSP